MSHGIDLREVYRRTADMIFIRTGAACSNISGSGSDFEASPAKRKFGLDVNEFTPVLNPACSFREYLGSGRLVSYSINCWANWLYPKQRVGPL
jgi:hypothetical protein